MILGLIKMHSKSDIPNSLPSFTMHIVVKSDNIGKVLNFLKNRNTLAKKSFYYRKKYITTSLILLIYIIS